MQFLTITATAAATTTTSVLKNNLVVYLLQTCRISLMIFIVQQIRVITDNAYIPGDFKL
jgi:hypothetical protein